MRCQFGVFENIKTYASAAQGETSERERTVATEKNCDIGLLRKVLLSRGRPIGFTTKLMLQIYKIILRNGYNL